MSADASTVQLVFAGEVLDGFSTDDVKLRVAQVLKLDDAKLHRMFSGKRVVIKRGVDAADADRWVAKFGAMGARLHVVTASQATSAEAHAPAPAARASASPRHVDEPASRSRSRRLPKRMGLYAGGALVALVVVLGIVYKWGGPQSRTPPQQQAVVPPGKVVDASVAAPLPQDKQLESKLRSAAAAGEFHRYMSASKSRAFAISFHGAWGWNAGATAPEQAIEQAIADCDKRRPPNTPECYLVHVDDQWTMD